MHWYNIIEYNCCHWVTDNASWIKSNLLILLYVFSVIVFYTGEYIGISRTISDTTSSKRDMFWNYVVGVFGGVFVFPKNWVGP